MQMTEINCKLCDKKIMFDLNSPHTYINKVESGNPMIGKLYTLRVAHETDVKSQHINVVVVDQNGDYRAHKDYYEEKMDQKQEIDLWEKLTHQVPIELRPFMALANSSEKQILSSIQQPFQKTVESWYITLKELKDRHSDSELINLLWTKWSFLLGKGKELVEVSYPKNSWSYPILLRLKARFSPTPDLNEKIDELDFQSEPLLIQLEENVAEAEIYLRLGDMEKLTQLFEKAKKLWGEETSIEIKSNFLLLQSYYSFGLSTLGKIKEALQFVEPAFNFGQILENREIISIAGNFYAAILQAAGQLDKALKIYDIVLETSKKLNDERMQAVVSTNISILESKQGLYDQALKRQREILGLPIVQREYFLRSSLQSIIGETLFIAECYDESIDLCKNIVNDEKVSTYYKSQALSTLLKIAGKTSSKKLLSFVENNLLEDEEFLNSPMGSIFNYDLKAINAEINSDWMEMVTNLNKERETMINSKSLEDISDIEIRLAQAYFKQYQETKDLQYLNHSYNHLDLAKIIALDNQNYLDLCRLTTLKGLLAIESELPEQAREHLNEALELSRNHKLKNLEENIINHIEQLDKGSIESTDSILKRMFRVLTFRRSEEKTGPKEESIIYSIIVSKLDNTWKLSLLNQKTSEEEYMNYLMGFNDLWNLVKDRIENMQITYFSISKGNVLIEKSQNFQLIALCDNLNYITRLTLQDILPEIEEFSLKHIPEELSNKVLELFNQKIAKFTQVQN